ncbi:hypothetical protein LR48_Vigan08g106500 [Vigna angularis]|uniref:Uncharacterized protein n=1 Tax=Phaseolus angularis TaxID=3914 RepID=A0A0L9V5I5_PHAAN|nr:hypothetical protein LR48_Vigan08g106500 [Vigna angularis]
MTSRQNRVATHPGLTSLAAHPADRASRPLRGHKHSTTRPSGLTFCRFFILKYSSMRTLGSISVRSFDQNDAWLLSVLDVRPLGSISVRSFDQNDAWLLSVPDVRPLGSTSVLSSDQTDGGLLSLLDVQQLGLNRSVTRLNDVRTLRLNHSIIRLIGVRQLGLDCSASLIDVRIKRPADVLNNVRPLALKSFGHTPTRALQHSAILMIGLLTIRPPRPFDPTDVQPSGLNDFRPLGFNRRSAIKSHGRSVTCPHPFCLNCSAFRGLKRPPFGPTHEAFGHSNSLTFSHSIPLTFGLKRPVFGLTDVRPPGLQLDLTSAVRPQRCSPFGFNHSTIHVYERSSSQPFGLPLISSARQCTTTSDQAVGRSASKVFALWFQPLDHPCVRAFKHSAVRLQRYSHIDLNPSTIHSHERSNIRPFDLKGSRPLGFNRSSIHGHEHSSIRPFDAINVVHSAVMTFGLTRSIWPHMPLDLDRPWPQAFSFCDLRLYSLYRSAIQVLTFGLTRSSFFAVWLHIFFGPSNSTARSSLV